MKKVHLPAFLLPAVLLAASVASAELPHPDGFARAVKFKVSGYSGSAALENFPVLVRLSESDISGFHYSDFNFPGKDGTDLCFLATDGTPLPYDVDTWDSSGASLVWVRLPSLQNGAEFVMCFRSSKSGKTVCPDNAFSDYTGVWHLGESGDGAQAILDSTANGLDGSSSSKSSAQPGMVGGARQITSVYNKEFGSILVDLGDEGGAKRAAVDALGTDFAVSFWMKNRASAAQWQYLVGRKETDSSAAWGLQTQDGGTQIRMFSTGGDNGRKQTATLPGLASGWHKVDAVYKYASSGNSAKFDFYWDGVLVNTNSALAAKALQGTDHLSIGGHTAGSSARSFFGDMDEVRLRAAFVPTEDWVKADYDQVAVAPLVAAVGSVESYSELPKPVAAFSIPDTGAAFVQFAGAISSCGGDATACSVQAKVWKASGSEPSSWTTLATGLGEGASFSAFVTGLAPATDYLYSIKAANNLATPYDSDVATGSFTTSGAGLPGAGGTITRDGDSFVHTFLVNARGKGSWTFTPPAYASSVEALVVAGGGAGGYYGGGGGGAGGLVHRDALAVTGGATYDVAVGAGGLASDDASAYGGSGGDSSISLSGAAVLSATGGGAGGNGALAGQTATRAGVAGGSGGGASWAKYEAGAGADGQGHAGGVPADHTSTQNHGAGGGGAAAAGGAVPAANGSQSSGSGGSGVQLSISGSPAWYAGGGGGGGALSLFQGFFGSGGAGGSGGGGKGGQRAGADGTELAESGVPGTGGGGGGGSTYSEESYKGGDGGSGVVVVRYPVQGDGSAIRAPMVTLSDATWDEATATANVSFRVDWAGAGRDRADVAIAWGYARDALTRTNAVATSWIGRGTGSFPLANNGRNVYLRAVATNAGGTGASEEIEKFDFAVSDEPSTMILLLP